MNSNSIRVPYCARCERSFKGPSGKLYKFCPYCNAKLSLITLRQVKQIEAEKWVRQSINSYLDVPGLSSDDIDFGEISYKGRKLSDYYAED